MSWTLVASLRPDDVTSQTEVQVDLRPPQDRAPPTWWRRQRWMTDRLGPGVEVEVSGGRVTLGDIARSSIKGTLTYEYDRRQEVLIRVGKQLYQAVLGEQREVIRALHDILPVPIDLVIHISKDGPGSDHLFALPWPLMCSGEGQFVEALPLGVRVRREEAGAVTLDGEPIVILARPQSDLVKAWPNHAQLERYLRWVVGLPAEGETDRLLITSSWRALNEALQHHCRGQNPVVVLYDGVPESRLGRAGAKKLDQTPSLLLDRGVTLREVAEALVRARTAAFSAGGGAYAPLLLHLHDIHSICPAAEIAATLGGACDGVSWSRSWADPRRWYPFRNRAIPPAPPGGAVSELRTSEMQGLPRLVRGIFRLAEPPSLAYLNAFNQEELDRAAGGCVSRAVEWRVPRRTDSEAPYLGEWLTELDRFYQWKVVRGLIAQPESRSLAVLWYGRRPQEPHSFHHRIVQELEKLAAADRSVRSVGCLMPWPEDRLDDLRLRYPTRHSEAFRLRIRRDFAEALGADPEDEGQIPRCLEDARRQRSASRLIAYFGYAFPPQPLQAAKDELDLLLSWWRDEFVPLVRRTSEQGYPVGKSQHGQILPILGLSFSLPPIGKEERSVSGGKSLPAEESSPFKGELEEWIEEQSVHDPTEVGLHLLQELGSLKPSDLRRFFGIWGKPAGWPPERVEAEIELLLAATHGDWGAVTSVLLGLGVTPPTGDHR